MKLHCRLLCFTALLGAAIVSHAAPAVPACPAAITASAVAKDWIAYDGNKDYAYLDHHVQFFSDHPSKNYQLKPDFLNQGKKQIWTRDKNEPPFWILCQDKKNAATLIKQLPKTFKRCEVKEEGTPAVERMACFDKNQGRKR
ncbi:STY0301 family protein [Paraherbaspirillum soli]|uniref:STY0301 family protein n=1 Tax=Paraherbaspirillum soli TaxID=631222 RepID=A0ABW0MC19_9BURK